MTTLEKLSKIVPYAKFHQDGELLIEAKAEIERLEKENAKLKQTLLERDINHLCCPDENL